MPRKKVEDRFFVDKEKLKEEIERFQKTGVYSNDLVGMIEKLAHATVYGNPWFNRYSYAEDLVADAIVAIVRALPKFDLEKNTSAYAFFRQCAYFEVLSQLKKYKKQQDIRDMLRMEYGHDPSWNYTEDDD